MHRLVALVATLSLLLSYGRGVLAAELAAAPLDQAPEIRPFKSAHFGMVGAARVDGITVDILGEGDLAPPDRQKASFKFGPFTAEVVMVGNDVFTRSRFEPRWSRESSPSPVEIGPISASETTRLGRDVRKVGNETVSGVATEHYTSTLDLNDLIGPLLPIVPDRDARDALASLRGTVDVWVGANDRMIRQERLILSARLPSIEPNGDPMTGTIDLTIGYSKLNEAVTINAPSRTDSSPLLTPRPMVAPIVGPAGAPATSTGPIPGPNTAPGGPTTAPVQAPAQVPRR